MADDHAVVRQGVKGILDEAPDLVVAGEVETFPELLERVRDGAWDLVLLDLSMPGGEGIEAVRRVRANFPDLPVLILSVHPEQELAPSLLEAGADGYVHKNAASEELVSAVRRVLEGDKYVSPAMASRFAEEMGGEQRGPPHEKLSERELQVLRLLGEGRSVGEIAEDLSLSVKTVSTYRSRLLDKMDMETEAQLIRYAIEHDLVQ